MISKTFGTSERSMPEPVKQGAPPTVGGEKIKQGQPPISLLVLSLSPWLAGFAAGGGTHLTVHSCVTARGIAGVDGSLDGG
jgi:hypothetical protein